jgi:glutamate-1-semialdehyde 2,1-aminomutase
MQTNSISLFSRAQESIPGGVNSPVRAFKSVGGTPVFIKSAKGAYLFDEDGNRYIDYINSWGPMILGHAYEPVLEALREQMLHSLSYGAPTLLEIEMAELIKKMVPGLEMIRMVNSGTEACMSVLRLARGYTGKNKLIKFEGCYHGHADSFLVSAGSGVATLQIQTVPGITAAVAADTLTAPFNDLNAVHELVKQHKNEIAAIIIEPVAGNMGCIPPQPAFLEGLREICDTENILLIFDEVMTGFRLAPGGAQEFCGIAADLVTFGKIIGAGLPVGAYGGKKEIMQHIAPSGKIYQAGTLSGNPLAMRAGYTMLKTLHETPSIYDQLDASTAALENSFMDLFKAKGMPVAINRAGSMISVHFSEQPITNFKSAAAADNEEFKRYFHFCLDNGIYLPPSPYESWFISTAIGEKEISHTLEVTSAYLKQR